jgi:hypothetical protein
MRLRNLRRLIVIFADSAYGRNELPEWVRETFGWILQTILRPKRPGLCGVAQTLDRRTHVRLDQPLPTP